MTVFSGVTSPANQKLSMRMTTLHEEQLPLTRKHSLDFISDETEEEDKIKVADDDDDDRMDDSVLIRFLINNKILQNKFLDVKIV